MKSRHVLAVVLGMVIGAVTATAQDISWEIKLHASDRVDLLENEVNAYVNAGYVPLGLTYDDADLYILYVEDPDFEISAWLLEWYDTREGLRAAMTANMENGYIPTGMSYAGDLFYVLYVLTDSSADAWELVPSGARLHSVQREIQPYIDQGYVPTAITALGNEYWTLLLRIPTTTVKYWRLEAYDVGDHVAGINRNIEQGYLPWGLMYNAPAGEIDILYVGF